MTYTAANEPEPGAGDLIYETDFSDGIPAEWEQLGRAHDLSGGDTYSPASSSGDRIRLHGPSCSYRGAAWPDHLDQYKTEWELHYKVDDADTAAGSSSHARRNAGHIAGVGAEIPASRSYDNDRSEITRGETGFHGRQHCSDDENGCTWQFQGWDTEPEDYDQNTERPQMPVNLVNIDDNTPVHVRIATSQEEQKTWVKYWQEGNAEPNDWMLEFDYFKGGRPGFGAYGTCQGDSRTNYYDSYELREVGLETNEAPNEPVNPSPENGVGQVDLETDLSVDVSDPDGDSMDVSFYDENDNLLGQDTGVLSGSTATVSDVDEFADPGTEYEWYAVADDGEETTESDSWSFTTVHEPEIVDASASPQGGETASTSPSFSVDVNHEDDEEMDVYFYLEDGEFIGEDRVDGSGEASASYDGLLDADESYNWYVEVEDDEFQASNEDSPWSFETDTGETEINVLEDSEDINLNPFSRGILNVEIGHSHANTVDYVRLLDEEENIKYEAEDVDLEEDLGRLSLFWPEEDMSANQQYSWSAEVEHADETERTDLNVFTTLAVNIDLTGAVQETDLYNIYRREGLELEEADFDYGDGDYTFIGSTESLEGLFDVSESLADSGNYCYVVTAENFVDESSPSNEECIEGVGIQ